MGKGDIVQTGEPFTSDYNNGTYVFCDEKGRPWIMHNSRFSLLTEESQDQLQRIIFEAGGRRGFFL